MNIRDNQFLTVIWFISSIFVVGYLVLSWPNYTISGFGIIMIIMGVYGLHIISSEDDSWKAPQRPIFWTSLTGGCFLVLYELWHFGIVVIHV